MRKYTSKSDKVKMYSEKYNLKEEEVHRILSEHEALLTLDELKIKYDCDTLGQIPDWITEEELDLMIWRAVHSVFDSRYENWTTREDLHGELQVFIRQRFHLYDSHGHIKVAIINRLKSMLDEHIWRSKHFDKSLDDLIYAKDKDKPLPYSEFIPDENTEMIDSEILSDIKSVKNKDVRDLLVVTGYLLSNISCLKPMYNEVLTTCSDQVKNNLVALTERMNFNDEILRDKLDGIENPNKAKTVKIQDIISAMNFNETETYKEQVTKRALHKVLPSSPTEALQELQYYMNNTYFVY